MQERHTANLAVYLMLISEDRLLLALRKNTGFADGLYSLPSGHVEVGESVVDAMVREANEEIGIVLDPENLEMVHVAYHQSDKPYVDFYWLCTEFEGKVCNGEPEKCGELTFFPIDELPDNVAPNVRSAIEHMAEGKVFSEFGFEEDCDEECCCEEDEE
jgi:8-oxo-dGTP diphosphatase